MHFVTRVHWSYWQAKQTNGSQPHTHTLDVKQCLALGVRQIDQLRCVARNGCSVRGKGVIFHPAQQASTCSRQVGVKHGGWHRHRGDAAAKQERIPIRKQRQDVGVVVALIAQHTVTRSLERTQHCLLGCEEKVKVHRRCHARVNDRACVQVSCASVVDT